MPGDVPHDEPDHIPEEPQPARPEDEGLEDESADNLEEGRKSPSTTKGAPWPAGDGHSDGPEDRPEFRVPTAEQDEAEEGEDHA